MERNSLCNAQFSRAENAAWNEFNCSLQVMSSCLSVAPGTDSFELRTVENLLKPAARFKATLEKTQLNRKNFSDIFLEASKANKKLFSCLEAFINFSLSYVSWLTSRVRNWLMLSKPQRRNLNSHEPRGTFFNDNESLVISMHAWKWKATSLNCVETARKHRVNLMRTLPN